MDVLLGDVVLHVAREVDNSKNNKQQSLELLEDDQKSAKVLLGQAATKDLCNLDWQVNIYEN